MDLHADEGLNFLPQLTIPSPMAPQLRARRLRLSYNGNYEGDKTMFRSNTPIKVETEKDTQFEQLDNDSEDDIQMEKMIADIVDRETMSVAGDIVADKPHNIYGKAWTRLMAHPQVQQTIAFIGVLANHKYCKHFIESLQIVYCSIMWAVMLVLPRVARYLQLDFMTLAQCTNHLRTMTRHVLWWMTLSKSGDVMHFARIVIGAPIVLIIGGVGLFFALYAVTRKHAYTCYRFLHGTALWLRHA